ncbi:MAG: hypothetical protein GF307_06525 [candidate division Zixibacteria bacterium]|nr:hypothetical protein [candidate division Zixibacteria bacterium]
MDSESLLKYVQEEYSERIIGGEMVKGVPVFEVKPEKWVSLCGMLRDDSDTMMHSVSNYTAVDYREKHGGFKLVITIFSHILNHRLTLETLLPAKDDEIPEIETLATVWPTTIWFEREHAELFGIEFINHPDPRHLMLDDDWDEGYPMRRGWTGTDFVVKPDK